MAAQQWHPDAIRVVGESAGPHAPGAGPKITHHTTEGSSAAGAIAAYRGHRGWPTFTVEWTGTRLRIFQHMPLDRAARALEHPSGPETNRANTVQIEHVGFAESAEDWPAERYRAIAALCRWIEAQTSCPRTALPGTVWGQDHPPRLGGVAYFIGAGHHGHQHVPLNHHWDPGQLVIERVLDLDDEPRRVLRLGTPSTGPDVEALQRAVRLRAARCGRPDQMPRVDGVYGPATEAAAAFVAYVLGIGTSKAQIVRKGLGIDVQERIRDPRKRNAVQRSRAVSRRRKHCKGGRS